MAAVASPTPLAFQSGNRETRRPINRISMRPAPARTYQSRASPQLSSLRNTHVQPAANDSSDDEYLAPIKLSAEAQAILGEDNSKAGSDKENAVPQLDGNNDAKQIAGRSDRQVLGGTRRSPTREDGSPAPRVVRVNATRPSPRPIYGRDGSFMYKIHEKSAPAVHAYDSRTPAPQIRRTRVSGSRIQTRSPQSVESNSQSAGSYDRPARDYLSPVEDEQKSTLEDDPAYIGPSTVTRPQRGEENGIHSTTRVRRIGTGTLLNRPVRRGMIRRQSEEDDLLEQKSEEQESPEIEQGRRAHEPELQDLPDDFPISYGSPKPPARSVYHQPELPLQVRTTSPPVRRSSPEHSPIHQHVLSTSIGPAKSSSIRRNIEVSRKVSDSSIKAVFKIPSLPPLESTNDQEHEPPPTFKRSKPSASLLELQDENEFDQKQKMQEPLAPSTISPSRPALAARSNNTPHRPAPAPPPKMSLIEAATSNANSRSKKSVHYVLNGRTYRRLDCIGRGGSSRVFRIMAENYKIFALKRVNLEEADTAAIAGYKGEIDLLQKLSNVDRVIRLFDYEVNEDKGILNVMMELGESDFNKMLNEQLKAENAKLDITFTRHYWKEMLECVQSVHDHDVVHSDLKPANFLLVKGQLKLIDFGIANAIQDDTVNVHRENQIGTPNYMSPESLVCHTPAAGQAAGTKLLKLGKPSDVWSLGCILYQMTYGQPPFAHIAKQFERIMSIPNPKVEIKFPTTGIGNAVVPFGLIKTLRRCLQRDQSLRPTVKDLLSEADSFLNPVAISPEMLGRVIGNVVGYCRKREDALRSQGLLGQEGQSCLPKDEDMRGWPLAFYDKLRQAQEEGTAW